MKSIAKIITAAVLASSLAGCATLFGDNNHDVAVNSNPQGADVYLNNNYIGKTPTTVALTNLWSPSIIQLKKPGFEPITETIEPKFQPVGLWNILWPLGFVIDAISGDMMRIPSHQRNITATFPYRD